MIPNKNIRVFLVLSRYFSHMYKGIKARYINELIFERTVSKNFWGGMEIAYSNMFYKLFYDFSDHFTFPVLTTKLMIQKIYIKGICKQYTVIKREYIID